MIKCNLHSSDLYELPESSEKWVANRKLIKRSFFIKDTLIQIRFCIHV